jgi:hypothetical protein
MRTIPSFLRFLILTFLTFLAGLGLVTGTAFAATSNVYESEFDGSETAAGSFYPFALATNSTGDVFVDDAEHDVVAVFSATGKGKPLAEVTGAESAGGSFYSEGIAVNASGDLYVADGEHAVVDEFEPIGSKYKLIREFGGSATAAKSFYPYSLATNSSGDVFVGDFEHKVVDEFNASGSEVLDEFSGSETSATSFTPDGVAVNAEGDVYISDYEHGVVDEFEPTGGGHEYKLIHEITGSETPQGSFAPYGVAVSGPGDLYVTDVPTGHDVVDRFSASGTFECQITGKAGEPGQCGGEASEVTLQESLGEPYGVAIGPSGRLYLGDAAHRIVDIFSPAAEATNGGFLTEAATHVAAASATLNGTVNPEGSPITACEFEYGNSESYGHALACEQTEAQIGEGVTSVPVSAEISGLQPNTKYYYRLTGTGTKGTASGAPETFTTSALPPKVRVGTVTAITAHGATLGGEVNPEGSATTYRFEDSTDGVHWTSLGLADAGGGVGDVPVTQQIGGLTGSTTYHVRLEAESASKQLVTSDAEEFSTPASAPQILESGATALGDSEAALYATIYPEQQATSYRFEYGPTTDYGTTLPAGGGNVGSSSPTRVSQALAGLGSGSTYHFRVVATNTTNTTYGVDHTFATPVASAEIQKTDGSCVNEALRAESNVDLQTADPYSMQLPDCRAYEQVTPPFKSFDNVIRERVGLGIASTEAISSSGTPVLERSVPLFGHAGADEDTNGTFYELERAASGWNATSLTEAASIFPISHWELASQTDAAVGLWSAASASQPIDAEDLYLREADGAYVDIGPIAPPAATEGPPHGAEPTTNGILVERNRVVGASADMSDVVFQRSSPTVPSHAPFSQTSSPLWPGDHTLIGELGELPSLYEYVGSGHTGEGGDVPALVGVDNTGAQITDCGTGLGGSDEKTPRSVRNGVSAGGSTVFFNAQAGGCEGRNFTHEEVVGAGPTTNQVYARGGLPGTAQATINVAGASQSQCEVSNTCNLTSPVTFQGASKDGSKVFFTTAQPLLGDDKDATNDIYECELPGDGGATPTPTGLVNACPRLKFISVTGTASGADVQSVVAVSEEGSRVYFTATGVLGGAQENENHEGATEGKDNLYVWEAVGKDGATERTAFIATLPTANPTEAQATPSGSYLIFTTTADLTSDDTSTAAQAFRYDAQSGQLIRLSVGQEGFDYDGNTSSDPATLANTREAERLTVSENGAYVVFQSDAALTPQVQGGKLNVYEWHEGNVYLISKGPDTATGQTGLIGIDASGQDIFFVTADQLVGQDSDEDKDLYDARINGGFPAPAPAPSCNGEDCQGSLTSPLSWTSLLIGSTRPGSVGNLSPKSPPFPGKAKPKAPTRAQTLRKALTACRAHTRKARRHACEVLAQRRFGSKKKRRTKKKRG